MDEPKDQVTRLLATLQPGDPQSASALLTLLYDELRRLALAKMANEAPGQTLQATALVEAPTCVWLRRRVALGGPSPHFRLNAAPSSIRIAA